MKKQFIIVVILFLTGCMIYDIKQVQKTEIRDVDLGKISDGSYTGTFSQGYFDCQVKTTVKDHKIINIEVIRNKKTRYAQMAEGVIDSILQKQTPNVDAVTGATTTSRALMKAVENSLVSSQIN
jgi:uncharacterized protein with FMN-binding domain